MTPIVRVIAHTTFLGVPPDLLPARCVEAETNSWEPDSDAVRAKGQDVGSDAARLIECAGRTCYDSYGAGRDSAAYHDHIREVGHGSVLEHASISFYLDNISRGCTHELVRHRQGCAISQRSTRYVDESESPWVLHPLLVKALNEHAGFPLLPNEPGQGYSVQEQVDIARESCQRVYRSIVAMLQDTLVKAGADKQTARKQARGAARGMLGNALCTSMVWTANIRALRNVIEQRASPFADAEIRVLANRLYEEAQLVCPEWFSDYERVACPDGIGYGLTTKFRKI